MHVTVAAGENWDDFVEWSVAEKLAGIECLAGIPGLAGATPIQNVGAYGQEVSATIASVRVLDRASGSVAGHRRAASAGSATAPACSSAQPGGPRAAQELAAGRPAGTWCST